MWSSSITFRARVESRSVSDLIESLMDLSTSPAIWSRCSLRSFNSSSLTGIYPNLPVM